jgi:hypothetical protein
MQPSIHEYNISPKFDFSFAVKSSAFTDCTISAGGTSFSCHRLLLSGVSPVLCTRFTDQTITQLDFPDFSPDSFRVFLDYVLTSRLNLSHPRIAGVLKIALDLEIKSLADACSEFIDQTTNARTILFLLREVGFALSHLPNLVQFSAALIEALQSDTDFSFLPASDFKLLIAHARFTSQYVRDDIITKYLQGTHEDPEKFTEFSDSQLREIADPLERTHYSAIFICSPPDPGLLVSLSAQVQVTATGMNTGRNPASVIEAEPIDHWYTKSDGNAWVMFEFTEVYIQPTDYGIWSHAGASTLKNWVFQGSNDKQSWAVLSTHRNDESVRNPMAAATWALETNCFFKYFRVMQTGNNWSGNHWMYLRRFEIWGVACYMDV